MFKENNFGTTQMSEVWIVDIIIQSLKILKRPIVINDFLLLSDNLSRMYQDFWRKDFQHEKAYKYHSERSWATKS